ncbi:MAG: hypothetical protein HY023_03860 [Chloroflexi bacterium]|nr:hypothetical protein [Chloroflexota bacterium]
MPTTLPNGNIFVSGMTINAIASGAGLTTLPAGATLTVAFTIPPEYTGRTLGLLFWDSTLDENLGGWIDLRTTLPPGGQGAIAPTVTPDRRLTFSGNFPGTFVLVALRS